jgi:Protein of unknown function (DUF2950)
MPSGSHTKTKFSRRSSALHSRWLALTLVAAVAALLASGSSSAQQSNEKTFASPGEAALALYTAVKARDSQTVAAIFGSNSSEILHTGDAVADQNMADNFVRAYEQMHRVVVEPDQTVTLYIGAENWPLPIPIVKNSAGAWYFDTESGKQEVLQRRVGGNENDAVVVLANLVQAQMDYASALREGDTTKHYALKFLSDEGKENGLYWKTGDNDPPSPIGPQLVSAASQGYKLEQGKNTPFHGYYYRMLTKQGSAAKGGALDYVVNGKLTRGFAFVAYPAEYRNSGVMTFIVNQVGIIYQQDLGAQTADIASAMQEYNPGTGWQKVE